MTRKEHLLVILMEECAEVSKEASKALRFGLEDVEPGQEATNADRLAGELCDLRAAIEMLEDFVDIVEPPEGRLRKKAKVERFLEYSKSVGALS